MIRLQTGIPGPLSAKLIAVFRKKSGVWNVPYPFVQSGKGNGSYFEDVDGNRLLDFASQIASNPLGYNHPELNRVLHERRESPVKYAGQDFLTQEHVTMLEELLSIAPKELRGAFLVNSGAEAVENAIKICMRSRPGTKFGISVQGAFHGRTLGALSMTNSKAVQKLGYLRLPTKRLPFGKDAGETLERILRDEACPEEIGFVILECVQGEGGYRIAPQTMVRDLRRITRREGIPLIADDVQAGMGRTGKWWAFQHFGIVPDAFSAAKALQIGAVVAKKKLWPQGAGAISSTWGGGHVIDMAVGIETIRIIRKEKLLARNRKMGSFILKGLQDIRGISGQRGLGLMLAFDLPNPVVRDNVIIECMKRGLVLLGCGARSIRVIPPFVVTREEAEEGLTVLARAVQVAGGKRFRHSGKICAFMECGASAS